jgi:3-deoxy-D-manno-octulosonic acid (KDO) 8-phosphate synthase
MIETHYDPAEAWVDGQQMITPDELKDVIDACNRICGLISPASKGK